MNLISTFLLAILDASVLLLMMLFSNNPNGFVVFCWGVYAIIVLMYNFGYFSSLKRVLRKKIQ